MTSDVTPLIAYENRLEITRRHRRCVEMALWTIFISLGQFAVSLPNLWVLVDRLNKMSVTSYCRKRHKFSHLPRTFHRQDNLKALDQ